jgi:hypothetical protein
LLVRTTTPRRRWVALVAAMSACAALVFGLAAPAAADPDEGGSAKLQAQLDAAARGYLEATTKLEISQRRQKTLTAQVAVVQADLATKSTEVGEMAAAAYRSGGILSVSALFASDDPGALMDRLSLLDAIAANDNKQLRGLVATQQELNLTKSAIEAEIVEQTKQKAELAKRKRDAEKALAAVGGGQTGGYVSASSALARPAPRNADGSWPAESCSVDDPTTSGCITPRTLHAMQQAKAAGFKRYVSCYRSGGSGEHPKGRACDFAAAVSGFAGTAYGAERTYGNNLAAYYVRNASRLGVLYVIWYRQIWMAGTGWRAYSGSGTPSSDHTNHVHLSMY